MTRRKANSMNLTLKQTIVAMATAALSVSTAYAGQAGPSAEVAAGATDSGPLAAMTDVSEGDCGEGDCGEGDCGEGDCSEGDS